MLAQTTITEVAAAAEDPLRRSCGSYAEACWGESLQGWPTTITDVAAVAEVEAHLLKRDGEIGSKAGQVSITNLIA